MEAQENNGNDPAWETVKRDLHNDAHSLRHFFSYVVPLACGYAIAAQIWSITNDIFWLLLSAIALIAVIIYFAAFVINGFRGTAASAQSSSQSASQSSLRRRWIRKMEQIIDNDLLFLASVIIIPFIELVLVNVAGHMLRGSALRWAQSVICLIYLVYIGVFLFVQGHRVMIRAMKTQQLEAEREQERAEALARDNAIASKAHDSVTGMLSFIAFTAQNNMAHSSHTGDNADTTDWAEVNQAALNALDNVHAIIRLLDQQPREGVQTVNDASDVQEQRADNMRDTVFTLIAKTCAEGDRRLHLLGFQGEAIIHRLSEKSDEPADNLSDSYLTNENLTNLITELYTNISKYADKSELYYLTITWDCDELTIMQSNGVLLSRKNADEHGTTADMPGLHQGLTLHRRNIERLGGTVNSCIEDGEWTLYIRIPF